MKIVIAVIGVFVAGFIMVGISKDEPSIAQMEAASTIRNYVAIQTMANDKCPQAIKERNRRTSIFSFRNKK